MKDEITRGDKVLFKTEGGKKEPWVENEFVVARVTNTSPIYQGIALPEENGFPPSVEKVSGRIPRHKIEKKICSGCDSPPLWNDRMEEYFCPFCDE